MTTLCCNFSCSHSQILSDKENLYKEKQKERKKERISVTRSLNSPNFVFLFIDLSNNSHKERYKKWSKGNKEKESAKSKMIPPALRKEFALLRHLCIRLLECFLLRFQRGQDFRIIAEQLLLQILRKVWGLGLTDFFINCKQKQRDKLIIG